MSNQLKPCVAYWPLIIYCPSTFVLYQSDLGAHGDLVINHSSFNFVVCPSGFSSFGSSCYIAVDTHATKSEAEDHCASYNAVVSPAKTTEEAGFIHSLVYVYIYSFVSLTSARSEIMNMYFVWSF